MRPLFLTIMVMSAIAVGCQDEARITQVKVLDPEFKTVCVITYQFRDADKLREMLIPKEVR